MGREDVNDTHDILILSIVYHGLRRMSTSIIIQKSKKFVPSMGIIGDFYL